MSDFYVTQLDRDMDFDALAYRDVVIIGAGLGAPPPLTENTSNENDHEPFHKTSGN